MPMRILPNVVLEERLRSVVQQISPGIDAAVVQVRPCQEKQYGDFQCTGVMAVAKQCRQNPRMLAEQVVQRLDVSDLCEKVDVAGPGFINFRLKPEVIEELLRGAARGEHLFYHVTPNRRTIVIDFSSPNVAKRMHVGHIRSTIIGDCLARLYRLLGHRVITDNHIGDWGTQFGMLILGWKRFLDPQALERSPLDELERLYKHVNDLAANDPAVLAEARAELVKLQQGDPENLAVWQKMRNLSQHEFDTIYARLGVRFDHTLGESFYNPMLGGVVEDLIKKGIATESEGAIVVFFPGDPELEKYPAIVRKSDGGFNYMTTDLATLKYRVETWDPDDIVYVTDARQQLHFKQLFAIFRRWYPEVRVRLHHVWFGTILGPDGKPFKTRSGEAVRLSDLLDEAEERAMAIVQEKNPDLPEEEKRRVARVVGIGAVKYADLMQNRLSDYVFSWEKMLALDGNTAPYLQYAYARIMSIFRKSELSEIPECDRLYPKDEMHQTEIDLARQLIEFGPTLEYAASEFRPNFICNYLYELATLFASFYESCPVLKAPDEIRNRRFVLCKLTADVLRTGLNTLGIEVLDRM